MAVRTRTAVGVDAYVQTLGKLGYSFALNECGGVIECNDLALDDFKLAEIRARMRAEGFKNRGAVEDIVRLEAAHNRYHPVRDFLGQAVTAWDGGAHIAALASYFQDDTEPHPLFALFLERWLLGAVAKVFDGDNQNPMLVLAGPQGCGKSYFARWLSSPLPRYFIEGAIDPNDKDAWIRLMTSWLWEVSELGATTRRADVEALKAFITTRQVTVRRPFDRFDTIRPALASLVGTLNDTGGFLSDPTGSRRFLVSKIGAVDWNYATRLDPTQVWGEAAARFLRGDPWQLSASELAQAAANNEGFEIADPVGGYLERAFIIDPDDRQVWTSSADIVDALQTAGYRAGTSRQLAMQAAAVLTRLGCEKKRQAVGGGNPVWGWAGVQRRP